MAAELAIGGVGPRAVLVTVLRVQVDADRIDFALVPRVRERSSGHQRELEQEEDRVERAAPPGDPGVKRHCCLDCGCDRRTARD